MAFSSQIFSCNKKLKKWRRHFVCLFVCLLVNLFFSWQICTFAHLDLYTFVPFCLCNFAPLRIFNFSTLHFFTFAHLRLCTLVPLHLLIISHLHIYSHIKKIYRYTCISLFFMVLWSVPFSNNKILRFVDFQARDPKFQLAPKQKVLKLKGSSFGNMSSFYVLKEWYLDPPFQKKNKVTRTVIFRVKVFLPLPPKKCTYHKSFDIYERFESGPVAMQSTNDIQRFVIKIVMFPAKKHFSAKNVETFCRLTSWIFQSHQKISSKPNCFWELGSRVPPLFPTLIPGHTF